MAIFFGVSRLQELVQLVRTDAPVATTTEALLRFGATFTGGDVDGTYFGINAPTGYTGNFIHFSVNGSVKHIIGEDGRAGYGTGLSATNFVTYSATHTDTANARVCQYTHTANLTTGSQTNFGCFSTLSLVPSGTADLLGRGLVSQPLYGGTSSAAQSSIYAFDATPGLVGSSPTGTISEIAGLRVSALVQAATTPTVTVTTNYGILIDNVATLATGLAITNAHGIRIKNITGAASVNRAITVDGGACVFSTGASNIVSLTLLGAASQASNYFNIQDSGSVTRFAVKPSSTMGVDFIERPAVSTGPFLDLSVAAGGFQFTNRTTASNKVVVAKGMASQSGNLIEAQNSNAGALWSITSAGDVTFNRTSSTTEGRQIASEIGTFATSTDASRKGRLVFNITDTADREVMRFEASGTAAMIGFLGAAAIVRPAVTGSRGGNAAVASVLTQLAALGLITDSSTA